MEIVKVIFSLFYGLIFIGIGFLVKAAPDLIAGYNTMSKEQRKKVDIEGLSTFARKALIITGIAIIIGYNVFHWLGLAGWDIAIMITVSFTGPVVIVVKRRQYDHNKKRNKS